MPVILTLLNDPSFRAEIPPECCKMSGLMTDLVSDQDTENDEVELPLDIESKEVMQRVVQFLTRHASDPMKTITTPIKTNNIEDIVDKCDADFIALQDNHELLVDIILAGNYLNCKSLLDLGILKIATMIKDKEPDQVKEIFHIDKDISPEEEKLVREANMWVFDLGMKKEQERQNEWC